MAKATKKKAARKKSASKTPKKKAPKPTIAPLNDKQRTFCEEYIVDFNGTQAAIRAGYSKNSAREIATENLTKPAIKEYVEDLKRQRSEKTGITAENVLRELHRIGTFDIRKLYHETGKMKLPHELDDDTAAAISGFETDELWGFADGDRVKIGETKKVKTHGKVPSLDLLGRHLGIFEKDNKQKIQEAPNVITLPDGTTIAI